MFAVANSALINMLMASRLIYGMSREHVLPAVLGKVHATRRTPYIAIAFTTLLAFALISFVGEVPALGGTTALLLLCVFTVVNVAVLVLRKDTVDHQHFRAPTFVPVLGGICCAFLVGPWTGRDPQQYVIAAVLIALGVALWFVTMAVNRAWAEAVRAPRRGHRRRRPKTDRRGRAPRSGWWVSAAVVTHAAAVAPAAAPAVAADEFQRAQRPSRPCRPALGGQELAGCQAGHGLACTGVRKAAADMAQTALATMRVRDIADTPLDYWTARRDRARA